MALSRQHIKSTLLCLLIGFLCGATWNSIWRGSTSQNERNGKPSQQCMHHGSPVVFHGTPSTHGVPSGSCWCSDHDGYCLCTPSLSVDLLVVLADPSFTLPQDKSIEFGHELVRKHRLLKKEHVRGVLLVERKNPPFGWAQVSRFVSQLSSCASTVNWRPARHTTVTTT